MTIRDVILAAGALAGMAFAQDRAPLEFEAASVKPSEGSQSVAGVSKTGQRTTSSYWGCSGGPGTTDPVRYTCTSTSLRPLVNRAWSLKGYQLTGPATLDSPTYDIEAKVPAGATEDQFKQMLQKLLIDRFHMVMHHETREMPAYVLSIGKGGHKLQVPPPGDTESPREALDTDANGDGKAKMSAEEAARMNELRARGAEVRAAAGRAARTTPLPPAHIAYRITNGMAKLAGRRASMADLTNALSGTFGCPVLDHTSLGGEWNFMVGFAADSLDGGPASGAMASMRQRMASARGTADGSAGVSTEEPSTPTGGQSIFTAFEKQLGLKLEAAKAPGEVLVVDRLDKTPVAN